MSKIRIVVVGGGHLGSIHAKLLTNRADAELIAVVESDPEAQARLRQQGYRVCGDYRQLAGPVDACIIAVPTKAHCEVASWFLRHEVHCFIEKPIALNVQEAKEVVRLADRFRCTLQIGHVERFNPAFVVVADRIQNPILIETRRCGTYTGRSTDIGVVLDLMIHDIDLVLQLVPSKLRSIEAAGVAYLGVHEDVATAHLAFENGCVAQLHCSRIAPQARREWVCHMDRAIAQVDFATSQVNWLALAHDVAQGKRLADQLPWPERRQVKDELFDRWLIPDSLPVEPCNAIEQEHNDFIHAIQSGSEPRVSGKDGLASLEIASAILDKMRIRTSTLPMVGDVSSHPLPTEPNATPLRRAG